MVRELAPGAQPLPNGLPLSQSIFRMTTMGCGAGARIHVLTFIAPSDGRYFVRLRDARGFGGSDFKYELIVRPEKPISNWSSSYGPSDAAGKWS